MFHMPTLPELLVILAIIFVLFGASRIPEAGKALGAGIRNFKRALSGELEEEESAKKLPDKKEDTKEGTNTT